MHMAKTSVSFCPLILCSSSPRHIEFQYEERKGFLVFLVLHISARHQLLPGDQIHRRSFAQFPQCASFFTCTQLSTRQNELHGSRRALHCKLHATLTLHYTQHYTLHYTQHYRNAARGSISGQDRKTDLYFHFIPSKHESSKMLPLPAVRQCCMQCSVQCCVQCSVQCCVGLPRNTGHFHMLL